MKKAGVASPLAGRLPRDRVAPRPGGSPLRRSARTSARRARRAPRVLSLGGRGGSGGVGEKRVVIVPELPLVVGAPRRFGRLTRLRVEPIDWGIPVRVSNLPGIPLENLRERRLGSLAEGVMEVGEFHDGHGCLGRTADRRTVDRNSRAERSEEHTSELQSRSDLVCRLLLEKKKHLAMWTLTVTSAYYRHLQLTTCRSARACTPSLTSTLFMLSFSSSRHFCIAASSLSISPL